MLDADAHKDMALASVGAVIAVVIAYGINRSLQRDLAYEWLESLREQEPKRPRDDEVARMANEEKYPCGVP